MTDWNGRNIAQIAVEEDGGDRQRCVELLSRDGRVDWNKRNSQGDTPLLFCLKNDKTEMARCLINTPGVDLDIADSDGQYPETIARLVKIRTVYLYFLVSFLDVLANSEHDWKVENA